MSLARTDQNPGEAAVQDAVDAARLQRLSGLSEVGTRWSFWKGQLIGQQGHHADLLYVITEGQVLLHREDEAGTGRALEIVGAGELFGEGALLAEQSWVSTAVALTHGEAFALRASTIPRLSQFYPRLAGSLLNLVGARLVRAHECLDIAVRDNAHDRVMGILELLAKRYGTPCGEEVWVPLPLTQAELGDMVGLARETVVRVLAQLDEADLIRRRGKGGLWLRCVRSEADRPLPTRSDPSAHVAAA